MAAPYSDPQGVYTIELPESWTIASESKTSGSAHLKSADAVFKGSSILIALTQRQHGTLDEDFVASGIGELANKTEREVAGVPCVFGKQVISGSAKPGAPVFNIVFDRLLCAIKVEHDGKTGKYGLIIVSTGGDDEYAKQHEAVEAIIQSLKWTPSVSAGER